MRPNPDPPAAPQALECAQSHLMIRRDIAGRAALALAAVVLLTLVACTPISPGAWARWRRGGGAFDQEDIWYATITSSAIVVLLAAVSIVLSNTRNLKPQPVALLALALSVINPIYAHSADFAPRKHRGYPRVECQANLRGAGQEILIYAMEHGGRLPDEIEDAFAYNGYASVACLDCPLVRRRRTRPATRPTAADPPAYLYFGRGLTRMTTTAAHVLACDRPHNHDDGNYTLTVLYGDYHVDTVTKAELERVIAEINAGHNPPRPATR